MSWDKDSLWAKSVLFMERASSEDRESAFFGLWASLGLELLARSAIAKINPALLAEADKDHRHLLHVLGFNSGNSPRSISTIQVLSLCKLLVENFTDEEFKSASSLLNRRNEDLHTGADAFSTFPTQTWLPGFYRCCKVLCEHNNESLANLFGPEEAKVAEEVLQRVEAGVISRVKDLIAAHSKVFAAKEEAVRNVLSETAQVDAERLSHRGHHRVSCPACKSLATVSGTTYGGERIEHRDDLILVRESVIPTKFECKACELKLGNYQELVAAGLGDHYTNRSEYSPPDYYELVDPNDRETMDK